MPVDPNEPTYCLCHQVSYGEMIGCDNPDVSIKANFMQDEIILKLLIILSFAVSDRMVPFCLCWFNDKTERKMVLSKMFTGSQKEIVDKTNESLQKYFQFSLFFIPVISLVFSKS